MAEFKETLAYEFKVDYQKGIDAIVRYKKEVDDLKAANKALTAQMKEEGANRDELSKRIEINNKDIKIYTNSYNLLGKEMKSQIQDKKAELDMQEMQVGSINQLSAEIKKLNTQYKAMGAEERNSTQGKEVANQLKEKRKAYEDVNVAAGNYKVMVGQYENQILSATGANKGFLGGLMAMAKEAGSVKAAVAVAGTSVQAFGKSLLALLANPIVAIISAIAVAIMAMKKAFDSSAEAQQRFSVLLAPLGRLMDALINVLQKALFAILSIAEGFSNLVMSTSKLLEKLPGVGKYFKDINDETERANQLAKAKVALQNDEINNITKAAEERKKQIELEAIITDKANKSYAQRKAASDELSQVLDKQMARELEIARERSRIAEEEASRSDNTLETNRQLAQYKADIANIEARRFEQQKTQNEKLNGLALEEAAIQKKAVDDARAAAKERVDKEKAAIADLYKSTLAIMAEGKEKEKALAAASFDSEIAALNERLATEKNLTKAAREAINQIIINKETEKNNNLTAIDEKYSKEAIDKEAQKIADDLKKDLDAEPLKWANKIAQARLKGEEYAQLELDSLRAKLENANIIEFESDDARLAYKLQIQQQIQDAETATAAHIAEVAKQNANNTYDAISTMAGGIADLFNAIGEDSEEFAAFSKALAIFQIGVNMAKGISEAVASSNVFEMAAHIASVLTGIAQAYKIVNSEKEPKAPKFADGGTVTGPGTGTSDSIPAMLSHGESVNTAAATDMFAPLYSTLNQLVGGAPIVSVNNINTQAAGEDFIAAAVAKGVAGIRPVVSVEDISTATNRVKLIDNLSKFGARG